MFEYLADLKVKGKLWKEIADKENRVYVPLLNAFKKEFISLNQHSTISEELIKYLTGSGGKDYYKLIHHDNHSATIIPFNLFGTLNSSSSCFVPKIKIPTIEYPNRIIEFDFKENSKTTLILTMNNGWSVSFRIHNASSRVEPSLKFDIQLQSRPEEMFYINRAW